MYILNAEKICKSYKSANDKVLVLNHISFMVKQGEIVAIMGPSGSGKTTLLNTLCGIDAPDEGVISIIGQELASMSETELADFRRENFGIIFQDFQLLESLSVKENILLPLILNDVDFGMQEQAYKEVIAPLKIKHIEHHGVTEISGGQKQRTAIARAFIHKPSLIFADEPTGNLDFNSTKKIMESIVNMNNKFGTSILIVTHDVYVASFCHRVIWLEGGCFKDEVRSEEKNYKEAISKMLCRAALSRA